MNSLAERIETYRRKPVPQYELYMMGKGGWRYCLYRLRNPGINQLLKLLAHIVEFLLIKHIFHGNDMLFVFSLRIGSIIILNSWDGVLETKRIKYKELYQKMKPKLVEKDWNQFSNASIIYGMLAAAGFFMIVLGLFDLSYKKIAMLFLITSFIPFNFFLKAAHTVIFAHKRVYIPITIVEIFNFVVFFCLYSLRGIFHENSYFIALIVCNLFSLTFSYHFIFKSLAELNILTGKLTIKTLTSSIKAANHKIYFHASPAILAKLLSAFRANFLLLYVLIFFIYKSSALDILIFFYIISPLINFSSNWSKIFYFDLTRFETDSFGNLRKKIIYHLIFTGVVLGAVSALFAIYIGEKIFTDEIFLTVKYPIAMLLVSNFIYSMFITNEYSKANYWLAIRYELGVLLAVTVLILGGANIYETIPGFALITIILNMALVLRMLGNSITMGRKVPQNANLITDFINGAFSLANNKKLKLIKFEFSSTANKKQIHNVIEEIQELDAQAKLYFINKSFCYICFNKQTSEEDIVSLTRGMAKITMVERNVDSAHALENFLLRNKDFTLRKLKGGVKAQSLPLEKIVDKKFKKMWQNSFILEPTKFNEQFQSSLGEEDCLLFFKNVENVLNPLFAAKLKGYMATVLIINSKISRIYLVSRKGIEKKKEEVWLRLINSINYNLTFNTYNKDIT